MKKQILGRLSTACILFTLILVGTAVLNIFTGRASAGWPVIMVFVWLVLFQAVDYLLSLIPFRTCRQHQICRMAANYILAFAFYCWLGWITLNFWGILFSMISYLILYKIIQSFIRAKRQSEANEINRELANRQEEKDSNGE